MFPSMYRLIIVAISIYVLMINNQHVAVVVSQTITPFITEVGGCKFTYYDDQNNVIVGPSQITVNNTTNQQNHQQNASLLLPTLVTNKTLDHASRLQPLNTSQPSQIQQLWPFIGLECQAINAEQLHEQFNQIELNGQHITSLIVRDSNLSALANLPQGTHEIHKMIISNTSIDLEVLKEGSESLNNLTTLEIRNEKISNIPQNFFQEMQSLKELRLDNDEIASLDGDAFHNLDDSLEILGLRNNRFNRFPMAVKNLAQLAVLDLSDNDIVIDTQENDLPEKLEPLLNLRELAMNKINCSCEFSSSPFFEWIARTHISGVRCSSPAHLKGQEIIVFERDEFCARGNSSRLATSFQLNLLISILAIYSVRFWYDSRV